MFCITTHTPDAAKVNFLDVIRTTFMLLHCSAGSSNPTVFLMKNSMSTSISKFQLVKSAKHTAAGCNSCSTTCVTNTHVQHQRFKHHLLRQLTRIRLLAI
jgi:hypothetical protein